MDALFMAAKPSNLAETAASRLRGYLAERRISHKEFGEMVGWDRGKYQRRLAGEVALDLEDLQDIEQNTPITVAFLLTGFEEQPPRPPATRHSAPRQLGQVVHLRQVTDEPVVEDAAAAYIELAESKLPRKDSNLQPFGYRPQAA